MIRKILVILIVLVCLTATSAFARYGDDYRTYLTIGGGVSLLGDLEETHPTLGYMEISADQGFNGFIATGRYYEAGRVEFSLGYHVTDLEEYEDILGATTDLTGDLQVATFLLSVFYDFNRDGAISPYFGGGIGFAHTAFDDDTLVADNSDGAFAYQLGLGLSFNMSENTQFDIGYKLLGVVESNLGPIDPDYFIMHNGNAALRFLF